MNDRQFVKTYMWAFRNDKTSADVAKKFDVEVTAIYSKANQLRKKGVQLPFLNKESGKTLSVEQMNRLIADAL